MMMTTDHLSAESSGMMPLRHPAVEGAPASFRARSPALRAVTKVNTHGWLWRVTVQLLRLNFTSHLHPVRSSSTFNSLLMLTSLYPLSQRRFFFLIAKHILCSRFLSPLLCFLPLAPARVAPMPWHYACACDFQLTSITSCFGLCVKPTVFMSAPGFVLNNAFYEDCHHHFAFLPPRLQQDVCVCWLMHGWWASPWLHTMLVSKWKAPTPFHTLFGPKPLP